MSQAQTRLDELRAAFDRSFAEPLPPSPEPVEDLLLIRVGDDRYALRAGELAGLNPRRRVVPLAGARGGLLGLAGVRGALVPVYSFAQLLGHADAGAEADRWLAICAGDAPLALSFARFDGHRQPPRSRLRPLPPEQAAAGCVRESVMLDGANVPVVHLAALRQRIQRHQ